MSIIVRIRRISELDLLSHIIVWHKEITRLLHKLSVVGTTQLLVAMDLIDVSSTSKRVTS